MTGMKSLAAVTFIIMLAVSAPAFPRTNSDDKADCEKGSGIWDWINTKCLASMDAARPYGNHRNLHAEDIGECKVKSPGQHTPIASE